MIPKLVSSLQQKQLFLIEPEKKKELIPSIEKTKPEQIANNKRKGKKKEIPTGQFLLFEDL